MKRLFYNLFRIFFLLIAGIVLSMNSLATTISGNSHDIEAIQLDQFEFIEKEGRTLIKVPLKLVLQLLDDRSSIIRSSFLDQSIAASRLAAKQNSKTPKLTTSVSNSRTNSLYGSDIDENDSSAPYLTYYETDTQTLSSSLTQTDFNGINYSITLSTSTSQSSIYLADNRKSGLEDQGTIDAPVNSTSIKFGVEIPIFQDWGEFNRIDVYKSQIESEQAGIALRTTRHQLIKQVAETYWDMVGFWQNRVSHLKAVEVAENLLEENLEKVGLGLLKRIEAKESEIQLIKNRQSLKENEKQIMEVEDSLKILLGLENLTQGFYPSDIPTSVVIEVSEQELLEMVYANSPDLSNITKEQESNQWDVKKALNSDKPDIDLSLSYTMYGNGDDIRTSAERFGNNNPRDYSVSLQWSIPLFDRQSKEELTQKEYEKAKLQIQLNDQKLSLINDLRTVRRDLAYHRENIALNQAQLELTEAVLQEEIKKLQIGRGRVYNVSEAQQNMIDARENLTKAFIDYEKSYLSLLIMTGGIYEKYQLKPF